MGAVRGGKGRELYQGYIEIAPTWTLVLATNHLPRIAGQDEAIWRRIAIVPFTTTIPEQERDPRLTERLAAERPGILNWALAGCAAWLQDGLTLPPAVRVATSEYRAESDPVAQWMDDCCERRPGAHETAGDLWGSFEGYFGGAGKAPVSRTAFGRRLSGLGISETRATEGGSRVRMRVGVRLRGSR